MEELVPIFDQARLKRISGLGQAFSQADPFPHIVIDDFLPERVLDAVLMEFPGPNDANWHHFDDPTGNKFASLHEDKLPPQTRTIIHELNSSNFLTAMEVLTGIQGLVPDPHLDGGGLHQIDPGGFLKIHADFNWNDRLKLDRRLNLLLYLNRDWIDEYGGHLELWDRNMNRCVQRILPIFNRCVIFETTDWSYHGHPDPLTCPVSSSRKSLALYYYTRGRPDHEISPSHSTLYQERDNERFKPGLTLVGAIKMVTPPVLISIYRHFFKR